MSGLNRWEGIGRLGQDVETRFTSDGKAVASLSIACSESWKDKNTGEKVEKTEWVNVSAFGKLAEIMGKYLVKGSQVYISGKFTTDKYEKDGQTRYSTKIVAREMIMLDSRSGDNQPQAAPQAPQAPQQAAQQTPQQVTQAVDPEFNDDIPF